LNEINETNLYVPMISPFRHEIRNNEKSLITLTSIERLTCRAQKRMLVRKNVKSRRKGQPTRAPRGVLAEALTNCQRVLSAEATTFHYAIASESWSRQRRGIANLFHADWNAHRLIAFTYDWASKVSAHSSQWNRSGMSPVFERQTKDLLLRVAAHWLTVVETLAPKAFASGEMSKVETELAKLKHRLETAWKLVELDG
jgi:hypothetical protein